MRRFIVTQFLDTPSHALSLHNIVKCGERLGRRVGEWHVPSVTSRCLSELINTRLSIGLRSYCAVDMTVEVEIVEKLLDGAKVLVWIPMRLGVDQLNAIYVEPIRWMMADQFSIGIAGYWFAPFPPHLVYAEAARIVPYILWGSMGTIWCTSTRTILGLPLRPIPPMTLTTT